MGTSLEARRHQRVAGAVEGSSVLDALWSRSKQRVLGILFGQPDRSFAISELIALANVGSGAVQREVERLTASGLIVSSITNKTRTYRANEAASVFAELCSIVAKTSGVAALIARALAPLGNRIPYAFVYGSTAKDSARATSDVDILVVSDELSLSEVFGALEPVELRIERKINPTLYTVSEFTSRRKTSAFLRKVLAGPHIDLVGEPP